MSNTTFLKKLRDISFRIAEEEKARGHFSLSDIFLAQVTRLEAEIEELAVERLEVDLFCGLEALKKKAKKKPKRKRK
jgi:hypothetical protein